MMESLQFSSLSSLKEELREDCIKPHYKESYRLAIDHLVNTGSDRYREFLKGERLGSFLSEEELLFITANVEQPQPGNHTEEIEDAGDGQSSSGTYWPMHSDVETPDLDLGWPDAVHTFTMQTNIDVLFHPPRLNSPTIKGVICKHIQDARKVIAIAMDTFTDADIFIEAVNASIRGVAVYILLNDFHLKAFLTMAESQDVQIQQLRNMRVRTVKGQDYLCRSGAKFHGAMEQKFLLVDCQTVVYGSYSFTWSFEKINLSMVQVITGHLVGTYDEEFRTLYARSTVPAELAPPEGSIQPNGPQGGPNLPMLGQPAKILDRGDPLRHTVDSAYRKTCERRPGVSDFEERFYEGEPFDHMPFIEDDLNFQFQIPNVQLPETKDYLKRHSYAGERQDGFPPQIMRHRGSNWNVMGNGRNNFCMDNFSQMPQMYRGQNMQPPFHGSDAQASPMQHNLPMLDNTSKSAMRSMRIESYLKNPDAPLRNSSDYLDQFDPADKANSFMNSRMRSSLVFRSTIPEHIEENAHINNYSGVCEMNPCGLPNHALQYSSMQWNPLSAAENRINIEESILKRRSLQILDDARNNANYSSGRNAYPPAYATVGRKKGGLKMNHPEILTDNWQKRHSVADPNSKSNSEYDSSGQMYGGISSRRQENRIAARINVQNGGHGLNLNEDQRSVSQFDVKNITDLKCTPAASWQEPPFRTVSAAALDGNSEDRGLPSNNTSSQPFLKTNSNKMRSLLNIPEKKEAPPQSPSSRSCGSTDTITDGDEGKHPDAKGTNQSTTRSSSEQQEEDDPRSSKTQNRKEEHNPQQSPHLHNATQKKHSGGDRIIKPGIDVEMWSKGHGPENRLYSRFEPFCAFEKKHPLRSTTRQAHTQAQEKARNPFKTESAAEHKHGKTVRIPHENKLEKFFQRMGSLMHKNKQ